jgi:holin-like protein
LKILKQILIIFSVCVAGALAGEYIPFPSSILSLLILLVLLVSGIIKTRHIKETSEFIIENMAFFFIPAGVKIIEHFNEFSESIIPILCIVIITTVLTFAATALTVIALIKIMSRKSVGENTNGNS